MSNSTEKLLYQSTFNPSPAAETVLRNGRMIKSDESPGDMVQRVVQDIASAEHKFGTPEADIEKFAHKLGELMDDKKIVFSTPILTNAGRKDFIKPLSACSVPPVDLRGDLGQVKKLVDAYHQDAMGTGFNLDDVEDPVAILIYLNDVAVRGAKSGKEDRPVGNMGTCRVDHPKIAQFISAKVDDPNKSWKFNTSIDTPDAFWRAVENDETWILRDGSSIKARELSAMAARAAHACADPGIISMDRINADNPTPGIGLCTTTAPCAEVGLVPGETCQFGYINLAKFVKSNGNGNDLDYKSLADTTEVMVRALDNALEQSISRYSVTRSAEVMQAKRKIGVGICGVADLLVEFGLPYDSHEGRNLCRNIVAFINYQSKLASVRLAKQRGSFGAMNLVWGCRYNENPGFIEQKYGQLNTDTVLASDWLSLGAYIRKSKMLRNCSTIALPPTGRSGLVISASTGVEPMFTVMVDGEIHPALMRSLQRVEADTIDNVQHIRETGSCLNLNGLNGTSDIFRTATEISISGHLAMVIAIQPCVDESISKTVNVPNDATPKDIEMLYLAAYRGGLKGITVYRNGSKSFQPKRLT